MPECTDCRNTWNWKDTLKSSLTLDTAMVCPYCGSRQYATAKSKKRMAAPNFLIPLPILLPVFTDLTFLPVFSLILILAAASISLIPFTMELTDEEEHLY